MNVRKPIDYSALFAALDTLVRAELPQMELYREIGHLVCGRPEKGAAVAAAEYLNRTFTVSTPRPRRCCTRPCPSAGRRMWSSWRQS